MKSASKTRKTTARRRREGSFRNVRPVAIKTSAKSSEATIPVSIKTTGDSPDAEALLTVEVETAKGTTVKRAALLPVEVKNTSKSRATRQTRRSASASSRHRASWHQGRHRPHLVQQKEERPEQDLLTKAVVAATTAEENAVNFAGQMTIRVLDALPKLLWAGLGTPFRVAGKTLDRAEELYSDASLFAEELAA